MPGRQAHGRPLLPSLGSSSGGGKSKKSRSKARRSAQSKALDAFALAAEQVPESRSKGVRLRDLDEHPSTSASRNKRQHEDDEEDDFDGFDDDEGMGRKKRARRDSGGDEDGDDVDEDMEGGADGEDDSEEWHVGVTGADEDSEIDSDEAFGESDEERFEGFVFGGSKSHKKGTKKRRNGSEDGENEEGGEEDEDDLESLGSDAIDLATALDQYESSEEGEEGEESESEEDDEESEEEDSDEEDDDPSKLDALQSMIAGFAGEDEESGGEGEAKPSGKQKLSLKDLGLVGVKDPDMKRSLRLMKKEEKATKPGSSKKLEVPLAKRQQDRLMREAAYKKTNETLDRWIETVKHNRRAEHLVFPLAQNAHDRGLDASELQPITQKTSGTELEQTILAIMEESGLGPTAKPEKKETSGEAGKQGMSKEEQKELIRQKRRERELHSREMARLKRIKKIKSKTWRRIHRKELLKNEEAAYQAALEAGELDSEEEREALDRRRALERVGARHKESKWAKLGKKAGRAVWDEDFRAGLAEMARRKDELRKRIEGLKNGSDDSSDDSDGDEDASGDEAAERRKLLAELEKAAAYSDDDEPHSKLFQLKFMQRGEELRRKENEELIAQIRRELDSDYDGSEPDEVEIGRRTFGMGKKDKTEQQQAQDQLARMQAAEARKEKAAARVAAAEETVKQEAREKAEKDEASAPSTAGAWSQPKVEAGAWSKPDDEGSSKPRKAPKGRPEEIDVTDLALAGKPAKAKANGQAKSQVQGKAHASNGQSSSSQKASTSVAITGAEEDGNDSDDSDAVHLPMAIRDRALIERAFAGDDVAAEFEKEKAEIEADDDEKEIDNTLPGWGSWVGEGVSNREKRRHQGRFVTKVEGIKKEKRKDYKLKDVIINEKRVKKNDKYLATGLPHPFESQQQYERSLRLPVGPEWMTKETFQDATKPRVIIKQGIIAPMSKPMY